MESKSKYKSSLAFTDLLFNVLIGFVFMFIVAFILINPFQKDAEIEAKEEFMVIIEWDDQFGSNVNPYEIYPGDEGIIFHHEIIGYSGVDNLPLYAATCSILSISNT